MNILLAGHGKMANALIKACTGKHKVTVFSEEDFDYSLETFGKPIAIHFGSGKQLQALIDSCWGWKIPLIQGSTKLEKEFDIHGEMIVVNAPNLSIPMIRFLNAFPAFAFAIKPKMAVNIIESHQLGKKDTSGTARLVANTLGIEEWTIKPVRDVGVQRLLGVPEEHLNGHAYHDFIFRDSSVEIKVSTKIHGRKTYAEGALAVAEAITSANPPLAHGVYELKDIMHLLPKE